MARLSFMISLSLSDVLSHPPSERRPQVRTTADKQIPGWVSRRSTPHYGMRPALPNTASPANPAAWRLKTSINLTLSLTGLRYIQHHSHRDTLRPSQRLLITKDSQFREAKSPVDTPKPHILAAPLVPPISPHHPVRSPSATKTLTYLPCPARTPCRQHHPHPRTRTQQQQQQ